MCRKLDPNEKCSGFFSENGCGNIDQDIPTSGGYYNERSDVDNEEIGRSYN